MHWDLGRRRKVRCIFTPGSSVCTHCSTRASECIDQREDIGTGETIQREIRPKAQASSRGRSSHRTPSSQLEAQAEAMEETLHDAENPSDHRPPLISILGIVEVYWPHDGPEAPKTGSDASY